MINKGRGRNVEYMKSIGKSGEYIKKILSKNSWNYKFLMTKGYSEEEAKLKVSNEQRNNGNKYKIKREINPLKYKYRYPNTINFWLNKGYSEEEAKIEVKNFQTKFSLKICIDKLGSVKGKERWKKRQLKWLKNYKKSNFSKISQEMFWDLYDKLDDSTKAYNIYFATIKNSKKDLSGSNNEYRLTLKESYILPDFFIKEFGLIIEFDGDYFHGKDYKVERDAERDERILECNYSVYHIKEKDYNNDKNETIKKLIKIIKSYDEKIYK